MNSFALFLVAVVTIGAFLSVTFEIRGRNGLTDAEKRLLGAHSRRNGLCAIIGLFLSACMICIVLLARDVAPQLQIAQSVLGLASCLVIPGLALLAIVTRLVNLRRITISRGSKRLLSAASVIAIATLIGCFAGVALAFTAK
jgi:hypothetical protein